MENTGKINKESFEHIILNNCGFQREEVHTGPSFGVDTSVVSLPGNMAMVLTSDPLTLIPAIGLRESAWLSVHLMANDISTSGLLPQYLQLVLNLSPSVTNEDFKEYWQFIHKYCSEINVAITGGHTCKIEGQESTIAGGGTMVSIGKQEDILIVKNAKPGDTILLTKQCAISSTAMLAMCFPETVKNKVGSEVYQLACDMFFQTSCLKESKVVSSLGLNNRYITAMHDVTEGGVVGAVIEIAMASGNGALIYDDKLSVGIPQKKVCDLFSLDYRMCIGAGAMLITCNNNHKNLILNALKLENIPCTEIGEIIDNQQVSIIEKGKLKPAIYNERDPYWSAFFEALKKGWK